MDEAIAVEICSILTEKHGNPIVENSRFIVLILFNNIFRNLIIFFKQYTLLFFKKGVKPEGGLAGVAHKRIEPPGLYIIIYRLVYIEEVARGKHFSPVE